MRMSCNGCRVLRKGCSENCSIRPCLEWIKSPDSQANATVFLAKFYGRAGLINLLNAGPPHLRSAIFKSLLYESCGRIVNPINGSVGLLWSGQWHLCQNAVDAVLNGNPIIPISPEATTGLPPIKGCDIRHVTKEENSKSHSTQTQPNRIKTSQTRFKRTRVVRPKPSKETANAMAMLASASEFMTRIDDPELNGSSTSHDSTVSHPDESTVDTMLSFETSKPAESFMEEKKENDVDPGLELDLTLGFGFSSVQRGFVS